MIPWGLPDFVPLLRHSDTGADFVANVAAAGWWDWEDPLPVVLAGLREAFPGAFYDVGANTGFYTILLARLDPDRTVRAFEPLPAIAEACRQNLSLSGLDGVEVELVALSDRDGPADLYLPPVQGNLIETKASLEREFNAAVAQAVQISCETLDGANARLGSERVGMVKVDVEGAEHLVLAGAGGTFARDRPLITLELLAGARFEQVRAFLAANDYVIASMRPGVVVRLTERPEYVADGWNQLLLPREKAAAALARLAVVAEEFRGVRARLASPDRDDFLDAEVATLPVPLLVSQLAIRRRLLADIEQRARDLRYGLADHQDALESVTDSASWRLTAPMRRLQARRRPRA